MRYLNCTKREASSTISMLFYSLPAQVVMTPSSIDVLFNKHYCSALFFICLTWTSFLGDPILNCVFWRTTFHEIRTRVTKLTFDQSQAGWWRIDTFSFVNARISVYLHDNGVMEGVNSDLELSLPQTVVEEGCNQFPIGYGGWLGKVCELGY